MIDQAAQLPSQNDGWLAHTLVEAGLLQRALADTWLAGTDPSSVWASAVLHKLATDEAITALIATQFRVKVADLAAADPRATLLVPESVARKYRVFPLTADDRRICVATADPRDFDAEQAIGFLTSRTVEFQATSPALLQERLNAAYSPERSIERMLDRLAPSKIETIIVEEPVENRPSRSAC